MKYNNIYKALFVMAAPALFAACSSDSTNEPKPVEEAFEGIELSIPSAALTRAAENPSDDEAELKTLDVFAFAQSGEGESKHYQLNSSELSIINPAVQDYKSVPIKLKPGKYHIYVLANISEDDLTITSVSTINFDTLTETQLAGAVLSGNITPNTLYTQGLPMSANYTAIYKDKNKTVFNSTNNVVPIDPGSKTNVYANLTFCVAKVRFTMLNGTTPDMKMDTKPVVISKYAKTVDLMNANNSFTATIATDAQAATMTGNYFDYPEDLTVGEENGWIATTFAADDIKSTAPAKWAWQGVWYIPETLFTSADNASKMTINLTPDTTKDYILGTTSGSEDSMTYKGLERSYYYDYVGYVQKKEISLKVRVAEWGYHKSVYDFNEDGSVTTYTPVAAAE